MRCGRCGATRRFAIFAILIAGLGVGASCTVFSVVNTILIHKLPFKDPEQLAWVANHDDATNDMSGKTIAGRSLQGFARQEPIVFGYGGVLCVLWRGRRETDRGWGAGTIDERACLAEFLSAARRRAANWAGNSARTKRNSTGRTP